MARFFRLMVVLALLIFGSPFYIAAQTASGQPGGSVLTAAGAPAALSDFESEVVRLVNLERKQNDASCPNLALHPTLRQVAYAHSKDMADRNFFDHTNPDGEGPDDRVNKTDYKWERLAENIAAGYETPQAVVEGWMNSAGHRRNILNCAYLDTGVGYYFRVESEWGYYWTQLFGRQPGTQPEPEPEPEPGVNEAAFLPLMLR